LSQTKDTFKIESVQQELKTKYIGQRIILLDSTSSTNDAAWSYAQTPDCHGLCVLAEQQTAGRGRRGRKWYSPPGQSILCSILIQNPEPSAALLTLAAPIAVIDIIAFCCDLDAVIKWPNDILLKNKKVAGILVESRKIGPQTVSVVGIGINVHQDKDCFAELPLDAPATSLDIELRRHVNRNELLQELLHRLEKRIHTAVEKPEKLLHDWKRRNRQIGSRVELESDGRQYAGTCVGIDPVEGLIVQIDRGPVKIFSAAHTTVIKNGS
jgi:BirA family transcriptional regulator, biotin operon repressor / biotin---[acetyl-CoA-carboxylase] ligase